MNHVTTAITRELAVWRDAPAVAKNLIGGMPMNNRHLYETAIDMYNTHTGKHVVDFDKLHIKKLEEFDETGESITVYAVDIFELCNAICEE